MLNVKELRIGNYVNEDESGVIIVEPDHFYAINKYPECYNPIPLTESNILQLGVIDGGEWKQEFEKWKNLNSITTPLNKFGERIWEITFEEDMSLYFHDTAVFDDIKYIHQLQNVYYYLSGGKELVFRP